MTFTCKSIAHECFSTDSDRFSEGEIATRPMLPEDHVADPVSAPEPCSVPWPDSFNDAEVKCQYSSMFSGRSLEAVEDVKLMTPTVGDDWPPDKGVARQMWQAGSDEAGEDKPRAKRRLHGLPEFVTTLIVRNIPYSCTQTDLQEEWPIDHFAYDYLHLPLDTRSRPLGYAYVNFLEPVYAAEFQSRWHGQFLTKHHFSKSLSVTVAHRQGKHANLLCVKGNNLKAGVPVLFRGGIGLSKEEVLQAIELAKGSKKSSLVHGCFQ